MSIVLQSSGGGSVTIQEPSTASNVTATLPVGTGTFVVNGVNSSIVSGTAVASTSGTSIDFTGIPSWVKRITVMFKNVSTNGGSNKQVQLGTSSGVTTSGYQSSCSLIYGANLTVVDSITSGFLMRSDLAVDELNGHYVFTLIGSNGWVGSTIFQNQSNTRVWQGAGRIDLGGTLDRVRITTVNGTDTFDAGTINILYE